MSEPRPPRLARWLLRRRVPLELLAEIEGDLAESYQRDFESGRLRARLRYWREALSPSLRELRAEARQMTLAPGASPEARSGEPLMTSLFRDLAYAFRMLRKSPGFSAIAILSLALGIGPNTAIFSLVNGVLFRGAQGSEPERLVDVYNQSSSGRWFFSSYWLVEELRDNVDVFAGVTEWVSNPAAIEIGGTPEPIFYEMVGGNYFEVLGITPFRGRFFLPEEDSTLGTHPVAVISHDFWRSRLGGEPVLGADLRINGRPYTVIGIAPKGFSGKSTPGIQSDMWLPFHMYPHLDPGQPGNGSLGITARVREGVTTATAVAAVDALSQRIDADRKARGRRDDFIVRAFPWSGMFIHPDLDGPVVAIAALLMVVVGLVLLVACINLAGFLLARATDRRREIALRLALGASRVRVARQLMVEALVLGTAGGTVGLGLGWLTIKALSTIEPPLPVPMNLAIPLDASVLLFTAGISLLAGVLFGLTPALQATRAPINQVLRDENTFGGSRRLTVRSLLVVGQMALAVVLMVAAGLFLRSLSSTRQLDPGFDTSPAVIASIDGRASGYESGRELAAAVGRVIDALESRPEIGQAAAVSRMPLGLGNWVRFYDIPGVPPPAGREDHRLEYASVSPGYFEAMDIPLLAGRLLTGQDDGEAPPVAVISREMAERLWPGESAVGRSIIPVSDRDHPVTVVGVVEDVDIWTLGEEPRPYLYLPMQQAPASSATLVVRGTAPSARIRILLSESLREVDPGIFATRVTTMNEHLADVTFLPRMAAGLVGGFALLAVLMSVMGLYGVVSYGVARRTREMGIRMSLGAQRADLVGLVVRGGLSLAITGVVIGLVVAVAAAGMLDRFIQGIDTRDPVTLLAVPLALTLVALVAALLPARRASRVDPMEALRTE